MILRGLITYGMIKNPMGFIIGAVENAHHNLEDFGYLMEKNILMATSLGLGTCWLGGTFSSSGFSRKIALGHDSVSTSCHTSRLRCTETLPGGLPDSGVSSWVDRRKPWNALFFRNDKPLLADEAGSYTAPLEMLRLAPSANNFQPWRVIKEPNADIYHFYIKRTPALKQFQRFTAKSDLQLVDIGIAMCHFALAANEKGLSGIWTINDPRLGDMADKLDYIVTWTGSK